MAFFVVFFGVVLATTASATSPIINASQCKGPNEVYNSCPAGQCGPKTCDNLINPAPCPRVIPPCPGGCICREGYLRHSNGTCIEKDKCPNQCKKPNERYSDCLLGECVPKTCDDLGIPIACAAIAAPCAGGCICAEGFVRNSNGDCIDQLKCPSCGGDPNAQSGCGNPCGKTCASRAPNVAPIACPQYCIVNGCDCKKGFLLDTNFNKCVPEKSCPKHYANCGANQTYVSCTFKCPQVMCPKSDKTILCKPPRDCPRGCGCKPNYRYNTTGECILGSDSPAVYCTRPNEMWYPCRSPYDWELCEDRYNSPPFVPDTSPCNPRCSCINGYYRNSTGNCVPESQCPPIS